MSSPFGTFDQGGNVKEWLEDIIGSNRGTRGGTWGNGAGALLASDFQNPDNPATEHNTVGFRVAMIPEPSTALLLASGLAALSVGRKRTGWKR